MADIIEIFADGTKVERDFTEAELAQREIDRQEYEAKESAKKESAKKREQALAKLAALGLEIDDLKALGLG